MQVRLMSWDGVKSELTHREREVLELVAHGYSAKEAASHIGIAPRTVESHLESVRLKLRAKNRAHMVTQAVLSGFLKISPEPGARAESRSNGVVLELATSSDAGSSRRRAG